MVTYLDKNNRRSYSQEAVEFDQDVILVLCIVTIKVDLLDALDRQVLVFQGHLVGIRGEILGVFDDLVRERG